MTNPLIEAGINSAIDKAITEFVAELDKLQAGIQAENEKKQREAEALKQSVRACNEIPDWLWECSWHIDELRSQNIWITFDLPDPLPPLIIELVGVKDLASYLGWKIQRYGSIYFTTNYDYKTEQVKVTPLISEWYDTLEMAVWRCNESSGSRARAEEQATEENRSHLEATLWAGLMSSAKAETRETGIRYPNQDQVKVRNLVEELYDLLRDIVVDVMAEVGE